MHIERPNFTGNSIYPGTDQVGYNMQSAHIASVLNGQLLPPGIKPMLPFHNLNIQPSTNCPRKFIIFDQTHNRRQVLFNPNVNPSILYPAVGINPAFVHENIDQINATDQKHANSSFKEDSDDIDALLGTEFEENKHCEDYDDDVVSTARTGAFHKCDSPDSCSSYETTSSRKKPLSKKSIGDRCNDKKRRRIRKMVKALKGIVPGANHMSTVSVLDEAVRYLKSLRVEVQKLGAGNAQQ